MARVGSIYGGSQSPTELTEATVLARLGNLDAFSLIYSMDGAGSLSYQLLS